MLIKAEETCSTTGHVNISVTPRSLAFRFRSTDGPNTQQEKPQSGKTALKQNKQRAQRQMLWLVKRLFQGMP